MKALLLILAGVGLTILCWGMYGPVLHKGQMGMDGSKLRAFICVGLAYFVIAIIVPALLLGSSGSLMKGWSISGVTWSLLAGTAGALGAMGIIIALTSGGKPIYVMPLVFGCAPVVNVFLARFLSKSTDSPSPFFYAGLILVCMGAAMVLYFGSNKPKGTAAPHAAAAKASQNSPDT